MGWLYWQNADLRTRFEWLTAYRKWTGSIFGGGAQYDMVSLVTAPQGADVATTRPTAKSGGTARAGRSTKPGFASFKGRSREMELESAERALSDSSDSSDWTAVAFDASSTLGNASPKSSVRFVSPPSANGSWLCSAICSSARGSRRRSRRHVRTLEREAARSFRGEKPPRRPPRQKVQRPRTTTRRRDSRRPCRTRDRDRRRWTRQPASTRFRCGAERTRPRR